MYTRLQHILWFMFLPSTVHLLMVILCPSREEGPVSIIIIQRPESIWNVASSCPADYLLHIYLSWSGLFLPIESFRMPITAPQSHAMLQYWYIFYFAIPYQSVLRARRRRWPSHPSMPTSNRDNHPVEHQYSTRRSKDKHFLSSLVEDVEGLNMGVCGLFTNWELPLYPLHSEGPTEIVEEAATMKINNWPLVIHIGITCGNWNLQEPSSRTTTEEGKCLY